MKMYTEGKCTFSQKQWDELDKSSRQSVKEIFDQLYGIKLEDTTVKCCYDLFAVGKTRKMLIEVKDRAMFSTTFGDIMVEYDKLENAQKYEQNPVVCAVNVYSDGVVAMARMDNCVLKPIWKKCPATTKYIGDVNRELVWKQCVFLPQQYKFKKINGKWVML